MNPHLANLSRRAPALENSIPLVESAFEILFKAFSNERKVLLCGNGGSASDAEHWAGELLKGFVHKRPLPPSLSAGLSPETAKNLQWALPAIPLTGFPALTTAFANDVNPEFTFAQLVTSGNSRNVCHAAEVAKHKGMSVVALTGSRGGALKDLADVCIVVPADETYLVQEYHLPVYHCLCLMLEDAWIKKVA
jgi:D-sedoheptulose 7-phosphate isomerase